MKTYEIEGVIEADDCREEGENLVCYQDGKPVARFLEWFGFSEV